MRLPYERPRVYRRYWNYLLLTTSLCVGFVLSEAMLTVLDIYPGVERARPLVLSWWAFAPKSPSLNPGFITDNKFGSRFYEPSDPNFNRQGFRDRDDFSSVARDAALRILVLGDSFTYGAAAIYDGSNSGFADLLEEKLNRAMPEGAILWNTGIPGIGQKEELLYLQTYFPIMIPQVVLLAFYENDFDDNMYPPGIYYVYKDGTWANRYVLGDYSVRTLTPHEAWLRAKGYAFESEPAICRLRTVSVAYRIYRRFAIQIVSAEERVDLDKEIKITKGLLGQISHYVRQHNARLIVMAIPSANTMRGVRADARSYASAIKLYEELSIPFVDMRPHLTLANYTAQDDHWTKEAHRKAAEVLFKYISANFVPEGVN